MAAQSGFNILKQIFFIAREAGMPEVRSSRKNGQSICVAPGHAARRKAAENPKVLLIDGEGNAGRLLKFLLQQDGFNVEGCNDFNQATALAGSGKFNWALVVASAQDTKAIQLLSQIKQCNEQLPVVILSDLEGKESYIRAINMGARDYFQKPVRYADIRKTLQYS